MAALKFWDKNLNPITMKKHCSWMSPDEETKKEINQRKKDKRNENKKQ